MSLLYATISGTFIRPDGGSARAMTAYIEAASVNSMLTASGSAIVSKVPVKIQSDGSASVTLPQLPQAGISPSDARWRLVMVVGSNTYKKEFTLAGNITWDTLVDVSGVPITSALVSQAQAARDAAIAAAASVAISTWQATTSYVSGQVVQAPDGSQIKSNSTRTSRASFDATEQANWTVVFAATGTLARAALELVMRPGVLDVRSRGTAVGDGSDASAAITAAVAAAPAGTRDATVIFFPSGDDGAAEIDTTGKHVLFKGMGPYATRIRYNGAGGPGTTLFKNTTNVGGAIPAGGFSGVDLQGTSAGGAQCENLFKKTGNSAFDWDFRMEDFILRGCSGDGFDFGVVSIVNLHVERFRVDGLGGWAFKLTGTTGTEHRPITFKRFTVDCGTAGALKGLMRVDNGKGYYVHIEDARLEGNVSLTSETIGAVSEKSWILNNNTQASGSYGAYYWLENVLGFGLSTDSAVSSVLRDTGLAGNALRARMDVVNMDFTDLFHCDNKPASNVGQVAPQDVASHIFTK